MQATVKVMRSYDYCHFEVQLSNECEDLDAVNDLRKQAAILVDEAVRQYKTCKAAELKRQSREFEKERTLARVADIERRPKSDWSIEDAAIMRAVADKSFFDSEDDYYYTDPEREHHFSMLRKFQDARNRTRVKAG